MADKQSTSGKPVGKTDVPKEQSGGPFLTRSRGNQLIRAVKANTPIEGTGVSIIDGPNGKLISADSGASDGATAVITGSLNGQPAYATILVASNPIVIS